MISKTNVIHQMIKVGAQWLIGRVLDSRAKGGGGGGTLSKCSKTIYY